MKQTSGIFLGLIFLIAFINPFASDIHVPALPSISNTFHSNSGAQLTISLYFLGIAIGQIICGPLSDYYGRRRVLLSGFIIAICGGGLCVFAPSPIVLDAARCLQGFGIAASSTLFAVILQDIFCNSSSRYAKVMSYMSMSITIIPPIAPVMGSYIQYLFGWRYIFVVLEIIIIIVAIFTWFKLPETNINIYKEKKSVKTIASNYLELLQNKKFLAYTLCAVCSYSGFIAYITISPFLFQNIFNLSTVQYGWLASILFIASLLSRFMNSILLEKFTINQMLVVGIVFMLSGSFLLLGVHIFHVASVATILTSAVLFIGGGGFIYSNSLAGTMQITNKSSGVTISFYNFLQMIGLFMTGTIISSFSVSNTATLSFIFMSLSLIAGISFYIFIFSKMSFKSMSVEVK